MRGGDSQTTGRSDVFTYLQPTWDFSQTSKNSEDGGITHFTPPVSTSKQMQPLASSPLRSAGSRWNTVKCLRPAFRCAREAPALLKWDAEGRRGSGTSRLFPFLKLLISAAPLLSHQVKLGQYAATLRCWFGSTSGVLQSTERQPNAQCETEEGPDRCACEAVLMSHQPGSGGTNGELEK